MSSNLIGGIVERTRPTVVPSAPSPSSVHYAARGFPVAKHRSQSAFARARQNKSEAAVERPTSVPVVQSTGTRLPPGSSSLNALAADGDAQDWRAQMSHQNAASVESMTDEERQRAISEIFDTLGDGVGDLLQRARAARARQRAAQQSQDAHLSVDTQPEDASTYDAQSTPTSSRPATPTRSALRGATPRSASRKVSFADVQPHDIHVYESQPSSPRKVLGLLAPRTDEDVGVPVQMLKNVVMSSQPVFADNAMDVLEDDAESIRARYFPNEPLANPSLEWLKQPEGAGYDDKTPRFDLQGKPIPLELAETLPSHLGLHHHAQGSRAGYTLADLLLLSHSTVSAQRTTMFGVLTSIMRQLAKGELERYDLGGTRDQVRERILESAISALGEHGSLGVRAVDVVWEGLVGWDQELLSIPDIWLEVPGRTESEPASLATLSLHTLLGHVHEQFAHPTLPSEALNQLLTILYRLARHSLQTCAAIMSWDGLIPAVLRLFLPVRHGAVSHADLPVAPNPLALSFLRALAASSREHAQALVETADTLLRYVVVCSAESSPDELALVAETLRFYECLGRYGLYSNVAGVASEHFGGVLAVVQAAPTVSPELLRAFLRLRETWTVCATDPHKTSPEHDLLWSQVAGWDWGAELLALRQSLAAAPDAAHADLWAATAAWLEGCKVNSPRAGETEKDSTIAAFLDGFRDGRERDVLISARQGLLAQHAALLDVDEPEAPKVTDILATLGQHAYTLHQAVRLAVATARPGNAGPLVELLVADNELVAFLTGLAGRSLLSRQQVAFQQKRYAMLRPVTALLSSLIAVLTAAGAKTPLELVALSTAALNSLISGDEDHAAIILRSLLKLITGAGDGFLASLDVTVSADEKRALLDLEPFLLHALRRKPNGVSPLTPSPTSIHDCSTQVLPATARSQSSVLPLSADWPFWPLNDLLQSGSSPVFKQLPPGWDATETDIVRGSFLLSRVVQSSLARSEYSRNRDLPLSRAEAVFACMRVFMLEHGQDSAGSSEEVFRDALVEGRMRDLLRPFTVGANAKDTRPDTLEDVARRHLGAGTPFFQFYTDFVALYDAVSFAHPVFAALLVPPVAMRYAHDYRRLLFSEFASTLKNVSVQLPNVLADDPVEFAQPVEEEAEVVGAMLGALVKGGVRDFLRWMCVHHVAHNVWPDLGHNSTDERRGKLLKALATQGDANAVREVVMYGGYGLSGPAQTTPQLLARRWEWLQTLEDNDLSMRLRGLFE